MPAETVNKYWHAITPIEAREALLQLNLLRYPHLKESAQKKLESRLQRDAYPNNKSYTTFENLQMKLKERG